MKTNLVNDPAINFFGGPDNCLKNNYVNVAVHDSLDASFIKDLNNKYEIINYESMFMIDKNIIQNNINKMFLNLILRDIDFTIKDQFHYRYRHYIDNVYIELFKSFKISYKELLYINKNLLSVTRSINNFLILWKFEHLIREEFKQKDIRYQIHLYKF